jgi:hypothetical protein
MPYNTNSESYYVELCIVVDYNVYRKFNGDVEKISEYVINVVNIINAVTFVCTFCYSFTLTHLFEK